MCVFFFQVTDGEQVLSTFINLRVKRPRALISGAARQYHMVPGSSLSLNCTVIEVRAEGLVSLCFSSLSHSHGYYNFKQIPGGALGLESKISQIYFVFSAAMNAFL